MFICSRDWWKHRNVQSWKTGLDSLDEIDLPAYTMRAHISAAEDNNQQWCVFSVTRRRRSGLGCSWMKLQVNCNHEMSNRSHMICLPLSHTYRAISGYSNCSVSNSWWNLLTRSKKDNHSSAPWPNKQLLLMIPSLCLLYSTSLSSII